MTIVAIVYCGILIVAAWPMRLLPSGLLSTSASANQALAWLGWPAGLEVFKGRATPGRVTRMTCIQVEGQTADGATQVLYDTFPQCMEGRVDFFKDRRDHYMEQILRRTFPKMRAGNASTADVGVNHLFWISDHFCQQLDPARAEGSVLTYRVIYITSDPDSGGGDVQKVREGIHHCKEGQWQRL